MPFSGFSLPIWSKLRSVDVALKMSSWRLVASGLFSQARKELPGSVTSWRATWAALLTRPASNLCNEHEGVLMYAISVHLQKVQASWLFVELVKSCQGQ